ncbi:MAG TPA: glycosyltransferase [Blastocatellia bacterium]|nr:glycosyltransferase [Blastocatellia bacterium]
MKAARTRVTDYAEVSRTAPGTDAARDEYARSRRAHWDEVARELDKFTGLGGSYHRRLEQVYRHLIPPGERVLELGCGEGDLLAALKPSVGVGVDFSEGMIRRARSRHPQLRFINADAHEIDLDEQFDFIILSDLVNDLWDVQAIFDRLSRFATPRTRIIINTYSRLWEPPLALARKLKLGRPVLDQNWLTVEDIAGLLRLSGGEVIRQWEEILLPLPVPLLAPLMNRVLVKMWPFRLFALTNFIVAQPKQLQAAGPEPRVSVIIPARNEAGNIENIFARVPEMGGGTELVFVEGHSADNTYSVIEKAIAAHPERRSKLFRQPGKGKGDAVRLGAAEADGEVLMILDADLTVPPEDLPRFYEALRSGRGEFINGVRLVYPMEKQAMRFANLVGNKFFSLAFSWLLGQPIKDTLCGTKVLWRRDYERIAAARAYFGDFDPFGDFDLLFGAARLNLKIIEVPIRYRERTYGETNIQRWRHGWLLLRMVLFAAGRIRFV